MSRGITATVQAEVQKSGMSPVFLIEFNFSTVLRFWTGIGDLSWNGYTWTGSGNLIKFTGVEETTMTQATGIQYELAGVNTALVSAALGEDVQGRQVNMWMGFLGNDALIEPDESPLYSHMIANDLLADPVGPFQYIMNTFVIEDKPDQPTINLVAESYLASLSRPRPRRFTHEDQQIEFPGDLGLEFVASIQNKDLKWGAAYFVL